MYDSERAIAETVYETLKIYRDEIREALDHGETAINLSVKFLDKSPAELAVSFVQSRVKDTISIVNPQQGGLFDEPDPDLEAARLIIREADE
jgi:hypothetical protein